MTSSQLTSTINQPAGARPAGKRIPLAQRAAAQHQGHAPTALDRVTGGNTNTPGASAFQSAL